VGADLKIGHYPDKKKLGGTGTLACADVVGLGSAAQPGVAVPQVCEN